MDPSSLEDSFIHMVGPLIRLTQLLQVILILPTLCLGK